MSAHVSAHMSAHMSPRMSAYHVCTPCLHSCLHACLHACLRTCLNTCLRTCLHTCLHAGAPYNESIGGAPRLRAHMHAHMCEERCQRASMSGVHAHKCLHTCTLGWSRVHRSATTGRDWLLVAPGHRHLRHWMGPGRRRWPRPRRCRWPGPRCELAVVRTSTHMPAHMPCSMIVTARRPLLTVSIDMKLPWVDTHVHTNVDTHVYTHAIALGRHTF